MGPIWILIHKGFIIPDDIWIASDACQNSDFINRIFSFLVAESLYNPNFLQRVHFTIRFALYLVYCRITTLTQFSDEIKVIYRSSALHELIHDRDILIRSIHRMHRIILLFIFVLAIDIALTILKQLTRLIKLIFAYISTSQIFTNMYSCLITWWLLWILWDHFWRFRIILIFCFMCINMIFAFDVGFLWTFNWCFLHILIWSYFTWRILTLASAWIQR